MKRKGKGIKKVLVGDTIKGKYDKMFKEAWEMSCQRKKKSIRRT
jgi:hypothetical protein